MSLSTWDVSVLSVIYYIPTCFKVFLFRMWKEDFLRVLGEDGFESPTLLSKLC